MTTQRIALITGGNRGLGRASAIALARSGVDIVLTYRSNAQEAADVVDSITALGRSALALRLDTTAFADFDRFTAELGEALTAGWGRADFDILINNAGFALPTPPGAATADAIDRLMAVHFKGVVLLTQSLVPLIVDGGRILNVSTGLTRFYGQGLSMYAAAKGAVEVYTRYLAEELGPRRISVNAIAPGATATDFGGGMVRDSDAARAALSSVTARGRVGEADDIGGVVAALLGEAAGWMTAQRIEASGGQRL